MAGLKKRWLEVGSFPNLQVYATTVSEELRVTTLRCARMRKFQLARKGIMGPYTQCENYKFFYL